MAIGDDKESARISLLMKEELEERIKRLKLETEVARLHVESQRAVIEKINAEKTYWLVMTASNANHDKTLLEILKGIRKLNDTVSGKGKV